jgi:hypothetical protein
MDVKTMAPGALDGVRVVDLSRVLAGPFCTMLMGDMGAEIIKIEEPGKGDDTRGYPPFLNGCSAYFANLNRNKKSVTLDLKNAEGKKMLIELVKISDVVVENYKPGTMEKLGLAYEQLKAVNPRIVFASISGFGQYGPYRDRPGYDIIGQAMGGLMSVSGWPDSPPTRTGTAMGDILAGLNCCIGILAALKARETTGMGQQVDVSLVDSVVSSMETIIQLYLVENRIPQRIGNRYEFIYPYDSFAAPTAGWSSAWAATRSGNAFARLSSAPTCSPTPPLRKTRTGWPATSGSRRSSPPGPANGDRRHRRPPVRLQRALRAHLHHRQNRRRPPHRRRPGNDRGHGPSPRRHDESCQLPDQTVGHQAGDQDDRPQPRRTQRRGPHRNHRPVAGRVPGGKKIRGIGGVAYRKSEPPLCDSAASTIKGGRES